MDLTVCIVGAGRMGHALFGGLSRVLKSAPLLLNRKDVTEQGFPNADLYFISTNDSSIEEVAAKFAQSSSFSTKAIVVHCSGALSSDILVPKKIIHRASFHPAKSISGDPDDLCDCFIALEGGAEAVEVLSKICVILGAKPFFISKEDKSLYHMATVFSSNFVAALLYTTSKELNSIGVPKDLAASIAISLAQSALSNVKLKGLPEGLTGPVARGDEATIERHLASIKDMETRKLYELLTMRLRELVSSMGH